MDEFEKQFHLGILTAFFTLGLDTFYVCWIEQKELGVVVAGGLLFLVCVTTINVLLDYREGKYNG